MWKVPVYVIIIILMAKLILLLIAQWPHSLVTLFNSQLESPLLRWRWTPSTLLVEEKWMLPLVSPDWGMYVYHSNFNKWLPFACLKDTWDISKLFDKQQHMPVPFVMPCDRSWKDWYTLIEQSNILLKQSAVQRLCSSHWLHHC